MLNVLVIDDEQSLLKLFNKILKNAGFLVETTINGYEGLEKFHAKHFDIESSIFPSAAQRRFFKPCFGIMKIICNYSISSGLLILV